MTRYLIFTKHAVRYSETFITQLRQQLGDEAGLLAGVPPYLQYEGSIAGANTGQRFLQRVLWMVERRCRNRPAHDFYRRELTRIRPEVVIAQFGPSGTLVMDACKEINVPLVTIFHGYDASRKALLEREAHAYRRLFSQGAAFVAVSRAIRENLLKLGAPPERTFVAPCGTDCSMFEPAEEMRPPVNFLAVGRFTEKKAPHLTILAFKEVAAEYSDVHLHMIGDGNLLDACKTLVSGLKLKNRVTFLGSQPHDRVRDELARAFAFVQHSVKAPDGDQEGSPVSVMEAGAAGVPVISTTHSGIPDIIQHEKTGLLVAEHDIEGMAKAMKRLIAHPEEAAAMGRAAATRIRTRFQAEKLSQRIKHIADWAKAPEIPQPALIPQWMDPP